MKIKQLQFPSFDLIKNKFININNQILDIEIDIETYWINSTIKPNDSDDNIFELRLYIPIKNKEASKDIYNLVCELTQIAFENIVKNNLGE